MSYSFRVEPYCENCPEFEVSVKREDTYIEDFSLEVCHKIDQYIGCKHAKRCENLVRFLQKKLNKKEN